MCAQEGMDHRLLPAPKTAASAREADAAEDLTGESCPSEMTEMSTAPSPGQSVAALGSIKERSEHSEHEGGLSSSSDGSFSLDEVPYAPDADADVCAACALMCAACALMCAAAAALACAVSCAAAGAAGACCARVGARVRACLCVGPYAP